MGVDYVDIFYSHRVDPDVPIEETVGALDTLVRQGKALYVGISSYSAERTAEAVAVARSLGTPLVIHQPAYSILNRWVEDGLTGVLQEEGMGAIAFTPLAQGLLTGKYLGDGTAQRAQQRGSLPQKQLSEHGLATLRGLNVIAERRGQTLAQMAIQWVLRDPVVASALIGASRPSQIDENLAALSGPGFSSEELEEIDVLSDGIDVDLWASSANA
jgi:L-glyceraldehyde 3-phosphate reductase